MTTISQNQIPTLDMVVANSSFYTPDEAVAIQKANVIMQKLGAYFVEREEVIETLFVALLCKHHILLIGPPGTAKTALIASVCNSLGKMKYFAYLLTKFTTPDELFGPLSIQKLKQDVFCRITVDRMPEAQIAYLDEVFNAGSPILNTLLNLMAERTFQGKKTELECVFGSTNLTPEERSLDAFFDRFIFRLYVDYIHDQANFNRMLENTENKFALPPEEILSAQEIKALQAKVKDVKIKRILPKLSELWLNLKVENIQVSDRRFAGEWLQTALKARAVLNGRDEVIEEDLYVLEHILWSNKADIAPIKMLIAKAINPVIANIQQLIRQADSIQQSVKTLDAKKPNEMPQIQEALTKLIKIVREAQDVMEKNVFDKQTEGQIVKAIQRIKKIHKDMVETKLPDLVALLGF
jgi:MoxR-like ATPase